MLTINSPAIEIATMNPYEAASYALNLAKRIEEVVKGLRLKHERAQSDLRDSVVVLGPRGAQGLISVIENPPAPSEALVEAFQRLNAMGKRDSEG